MSRFPWSRIASQPTQRSAALYGIDKRLHLTISLHLYCVAMLMCFRETRFSCFLKSCWCLSISNEEDSCVVEIPDPLPGSQEELQPFSSNSDINL